MTAQTANKATVPVGSDGWNLTTHIRQAAESTRSVIPVADQAERDGLAALFPGGVLPVPTFVSRIDRGYITETWNGTGWVGLPHAEFTGSIQVEANLPYGPGALTKDASMSTNSANITSPASDKLYLTPGTYTIHARLALSAAAVGTTYAVLMDDVAAVDYTSADVLPGYKVANLTIPNFRVTTAQNVRIRYYTGTTGLPTLTTRVRVTRIG